MKTYKQRTDSILRKAEKIKKKQKTTRISLVSCICAALVAFNLVLFIPYDTSLPDVSAYASSEYYSVITHLNKLTYKKPKYKNNFQKWSAGIAEFMENLGLGVKDGLGGSNMMPEMEHEKIDEITNEGKYEETTDNQVTDVIEGDLIKRTDKYIFYLRGANAYSYQSELQVYSIAQAQSKQVASYTVSVGNNERLYASPELYLSTDCTRITLIYPTYVVSSASESYTSVISLDITDLNDIKEVNRVYISGSYTSSRLAEGKILLVNDYRVKGTPNYDDESTYLPQYGKLGEMESIAGEDIVCPQEPSLAKYTVVCQLDEKTLSIEDSMAFLDYSEEVYVSKENIWLTNESLERRDTATGYETVSTTEFSCVSYAGEGLEYKGSVTLEGSVKNQYSMDEYEGILRVVTTYRRTRYVEDKADSTYYVVLSGVEINANLYCVDVTDFSVVGKKEKFAPEGETVESVRFDKEKAYVCTAVVVTLTDPVFAFDLSDPSRITSVDSGIVDGYSFALVNFTDGTLLGIGQEDWDTWKIEIYEETNVSMESVCVYYIKDAEISMDYKSYLIDRENGFIGFGVNTYVTNYGYQTQYRLLAFDGYHLTELVVEQVGSDLGNPQTMRAVYIDGWLYTFGEEFIVREVR